MEDTLQLMQLGYIGIAATEVAAWREFASDFLGMQVIEKDGERLALRMDARRQRFSVEKATRDGLAYIGLEVPDARALATAAERLKAAGHEVHAATAGELQLREVGGMSWLLDPDGRRVELFFGALDSDEPFVPGRPIGGFRTGDLGLGHIVLETNQFQEVVHFYQVSLGFRLSDYMDEGPIKANFMHMNPRHHSLAIIQADAPRLHHVMVEYIHLDDVGRLYDRALEAEGRVVVTLGRHSNDHMLSFYSRSPSGFLIETGWAGRLIDDATWKPEPLYGPSIWGHERGWLPPEGRDAARNQRNAAADKGVREPTEVIESPAFNLARLARKN
jgi:2,3-dihydroxybiphenyl 1,2-dioxygenase